MSEAEGFNTDVFNTGPADEDEVVLAAPEAEIRAWAISVGLLPSDSRGELPTEIVDAFLATHTVNEDTCEITPLESPDEG